MSLLVRGELPNNPAKKRKTISDAIFWAAHATEFHRVNMMYVP
jgi:hypothetical protein